MNIIFNTVCNFKDILDDGDLDIQDISAGKQPEAKIGHFRADHDGRRWQTVYFPCHEDLKTEDMRKEINGVFTEIIKNRFKNPETVTEFCYSNKKARFGEYIYNFYIEHEMCNYCLVFILMHKEYSMYLHIYKKY